MRLSLGVGKLAVLLVQETQIDKGVHVALLTSRTYSMQAVRKDLANWFGEGEVSHFKFLKLYRIPFSLPSSGATANLKQSHELGSNVFICGDHRMSSSLHDAIVSGRRAAAAVTAATPAPISVPA